MSERHIDDRDFQAQVCSSQLAKLLEWEKWSQEIPYINFPDNFLVRVIPPRSGAIVRFLIKNKEMPSAAPISVYLDCYGILGSCDAPYWEIYPDKDGSNTRVLMQEIEELIAEIQAALEVGDE